MYSCVGKRSDEESDSDLEVSAEEAGTLSISFVSNDSNKESISMDSTELFAERLMAELVPLAFDPSLPFRTAPRFFLDSFRFRLTREASDGI